MARTRTPQHGAIAVEFALVLLPMLILCFGITELGRSLYLYNGLVKATRGAARHLSQQNLASPPAGQTAEGIRLESFDRFDAEALQVRSAADLPRAFAALPQGSAKGNSSPYQSLKRGEPTGIESINGKLVEFGRRHGLAMSLNGEILRLIGELEAGRLAMGWENVRSLEAPARQYVLSQV